MGQDHLYRRVERICHKERVGSAYLFSGPCDGAFPRYFFNQETGQCELFTWGGCDGVVPFETWQECVSGCQDSGLVEIEGHYSWGFEVNAIYPCDTMEQWWIGLDTVTDARIRLKRLYPTLSS